MVEGRGTQGEKNSEQEEGSFKEKRNRLEKRAEWGVKKKLLHRHMFRRKLLWDRTVV